MSLTTQQLLIAFTLGTAGLALWSYVRWPKLAPRSIGAAVLHILLALVLMRVALGVLELGAGTDYYVALGALVLAVVPVLTYAFLASIWFLRMFADELRGA